MDVPLAWLLPAAINKCSTVQRKTIEHYATHEVYQHYSLMLRFVYYVISTLPHSTVRDSALVKKLPANAEDTG